MDDDRLGMPIENLTRSPLARRRIRSFVVGTRVFFFASLIVHGDISTFVLQIAWNFSTTSSCIASPNGKIDSLCGKSNGTVNQANLGSTGVIAA